MPIFLLVSAHFSNKPPFFPSSCCKGNGLEGGDS